MLGMKKVKTTMEHPVRIFMHNDGKKKVHRFATPVFRYVASVSSRSVEGNIVDFVTSWSDAGWLLKGAINLPATPKGSVYSGQFYYPVMCFFEACE